MAKYAYAPLSIDEDRRRRIMSAASAAGGSAMGDGGGGDPSSFHHSGATAASVSEDPLVNERMPLCVGFCVLLAIIYVLSRTGSQDAMINVDRPTPLSSQQQQQVVATAVTETTTTTTTHGNVRAPTVQPVLQQQQLYEEENDDFGMFGKYKTNSNGNNNNGDVYQPTNKDSNEYYNQSPQQGNTEDVYHPEDTSFENSDFEFFAGNHQDNQSGDVYQYNSNSNTNSNAYNPQDDSAAPPLETTSFDKKDGCNCPDITNNADELIAILRAKALASSPPHIIECAKAKQGENQAACHLPSEQRYAALGQKGATLWMTGCSGAGKTTIATALEEKLVKHYGKHVYRLDGDNLRTGINRDLGFSQADRAESVRRTGELATLFTDAGVITLVGLISPYIADRDAVRKRHVEQGLPFYEVFLDVPIEELKKRDPKGLYKSVAEGKLKHFTCIDDPYEAPVNPEIIVRTHEQDIEESVNQLFRRLERDGILIGAPKLAPPGLPNPDGDVVVDLHVPEHLKEERKREAAHLPKVLITDIELNWLQTIGEGWASPLKGFMREGTLLETLHFNSILTDPFNLTGNVNRLQQKTDFTNFPDNLPPNRVSMSVPITLSCTSYTRDLIQGDPAVALVTTMGQTVAILRDPEVYNNRKEEIVTRMFGVIDMDHPYIKYIYSGGDYLIGGEIELLERIRYNDGLDQWRKTAQELLQEFQQKGADTVYAFQTRNPTHAGHAYLMRSAGQDLRKKGYQKPVLWLSPLGGWTKPDDVPLDVRVKQHEEVLEAGLTHPGGLDPETTVMAIWPSPMVYAGPTEVQFHAKSRRSAGASYFVVGRDPAGMKGSPNALAHPDDDLYDGDHGRYVLQYSPGIGDMQMLSFVKVMYDITDNIMKEPDPNRPDDFISISGSKMRLLAQNGAIPCDKKNIPTNLVEANCVPAGFMVPEGWKRVVDYYKNIDSDRWIPWSKPIVVPPTASGTEHSGGNFGTPRYQLRSKQYQSWWHDVPLRPNDADRTVINMITEIPFHMTPKMELQKSLPNNPIAQDVNKDGSARHYTFGVPFFNYGAIPQTWEDPDVRSPGGYGGDNDPLDVIEFGSAQLPIGSVTPCRILGSFELIDEGETDFKILCIALSDRDASQIHDLNDLNRLKPWVLPFFKHWLKRYKTSDGKPENRLTSEVPKTVQQTIAVVDEQHKRWRALCGHDGTLLSSLSSKTSDFWLSSSGCRGQQHRHK